jgi:putative transcriptional regulator
MKSSVGKEMVRRLREFKKALENKEVISEQFTCKRLVLDLQPTPYEPAMVKKTRKSLGVSQALFAQFLGVSAQTVRAWEQGVNLPNDMACRFLDEIRADPKYWRHRLYRLASVKTTDKDVSLVKCR